MSFFSTAGIAFGLAAILFSLVDIFWRPNRAATLNERASNPKREPPGGPLFGLFVGIVMVAMGVGALIVDTW